MPEPLRGHTAPADDDRARTPDIRFADGADGADGVADPAARVDDDERHEHARSTLATLERSQR